jgi:uncharacterized protein
MEKKAMMSAPPKKEPLKVILDSNALFVPLQFKIDVFEETRRLLNRNVQFVLLSAVKNELEMLSMKGSPQEQKTVFYALKLSEKCTFVKVDAPKSMLVDDVIVKTAKEWHSPVFTNDSQLRRKLRDISVTVIYVRQKSRLELDGLI